MSTGNYNTFDHTGRTDTYAGFLETAAELEATKEDICAFIETTVAHANSNGVVVAMSGGIDSTLTARWRSKPSAVIV